MNTFAKIVIWGWFFLGLAPFIAGVVIGNTLGVALGVVGSIILVAWIFFVLYIAAKMNTDI